MADWIKMRSGLLTNPKVIRMARLLAEDRFFMNWWTRGTKTECDASVYEICDVTVVTRVTVGSLLSVWAAVNDCASQDGFVKGITLFEVDEMAGVPGFGNAMEAVGWVYETLDGLVFPNFHEHNTVGKERSSGAKTGAQRTREWRERKSSVTSIGDVTVTSRCDHREEEKREEKEKTTRASTLSKSDLIADGLTEQTAADWLTHRLKKKAPLTATAWTGFKREAAKAGWSLQDAVEKAMARGWQGFEAAWVATEGQPQAGAMKFAGLK